MLAGEQKWRAFYRKKNEGPKITGGEKGERHHKPNCYSVGNYVKRTVWLMLSVTMVIIVPLISLYLRVLSN